MSLDLFFKLFQSGCYFSAREEKVFKLRASKEDCDLSSHQKSDSLYLGFAAKVEE